MITVCCSAVVGCSCSRSAADNSSNPQYVRVPRRMEDVVFSVNRRLLAAKQERYNENFAKHNIWKMHLPHVHQVSDIIRCMFFWIFFFPISVTFNEKRCYS